MKKKLRLLPLLCLLVLSACDLLVAKPPYAYGKIRLLHGPARDDGQDIILRLEVHNRGTAAISAVTVIFYLFAEDGASLPGLSTNAIKAGGDCHIPPGGTGLIDIELKKYFYYFVERRLVVESLCVNILAFDDGRQWKDLALLYQYPDAIVSEEP